MDLKLSLEESKLQLELREWLTRNYGFARHLQRTESTQARDPEIWDALVKNGWIDRAMPRHDDLEQSLVDAALIAEEFGRALLVEPFFRSAYLAANLVYEVVEPDRARDMVGAIGRGEHRYACALYEPHGRFRLSCIATKAEDRGGSWSLSGRKSMVMDGADADSILVTARTPDGQTGIFLVSGADERVRRTRFFTIDDQAAADIELEDAEGLLLAVGDQVPTAIESAVDRAIAVSGAEVVGAAEVALAETAEYAAKREQFGRPIAAFQAVSHRLARMFIELELLRGGLIEVLATARATGRERAQAAAGLKVLIGDKGRFIANQIVQIHGGVGTVNSYKVSHCYKRIHALDLLYGNGEFHLERYAEMLE